MKFPPHISPELAKELESDPYFGGFYDPEEIAAEKVRARQKDAEDVKSGKYSVEEIHKRNGQLAYQFAKRASIDYDDLADLV
jgi:hypothetical protein